MVKKDKIQRKNFELVQVAESPLSPSPSTFQPTETPQSLGILVDEDDTEYINTQNPGITLTTLDGKSWASNIYQAQMG